MTLDDCVKALEGQKRSKYRNVRTPGPAPDGGRRVYHSGREAGYAQALEYRKRAGEIRSWRPQVRIPLEVAGSAICVLIVDFEVSFPDGRVEIHEVKGAPPTAVWKLKKRLFEALYPERRLVVVR